VALDIQDDGIGFDPQNPSSAERQDSGGYGLQAMQQRVEFIGGAVILESILGQGTTLAIQVPISETESKG
jgi:signal transduction histidine kinase